MDKDKLSPSGFAVALWTLGAIAILVGIACYLGDVEHSELGAPARDLAAAVYGVLLVALGSILNSLSLIERRLRQR